MATGQQQEGKESPRYFFRSVSDRNYPCDFINRGTRLVNTSVVLLVRIILSKEFSKILDKFDTFVSFPVTFLITVNNLKREKGIDRNDRRIPPTLHSFSSSP